MIQDFIHSQKIFLCINTIAEDPVATLEATNTWTSLAEKVENELTPKTIEIFQIDLSECWGFDHIHRNHFFAKSHKTKPATVAQHTARLHFGLCSNKFDQGMTLRVQLV